MKFSDWLSERILFCLLIIGGYLGLLFWSMSPGKLDQSQLTIMSTGLGVLGTAIGAIVAAIWKSDRADKQNASTMATLADAVAAQAPPPPSTLSVQTTQTIPATGPLAEPKQGT